MRNDVYDMEDSAGDVQGRLSFVRACLVRQWSASCYQINSQRPHLRKLVKFVLQELDRDPLSRRRSSKTSEIEQLVYGACLPA